MKMTQAMNKLVFLTTASWFATAIPLRAQVPGLLPAPSCSQEQRPQLEQTRSDLQSEQDTVVQKGNDLKRDCKDVVVGSGQDAACQRRQDEFEPQKQEYTRKANVYNGDVRRVLRGCVDSLAEAVARDQRAIRNLGIDRTARQFDEWVDWAASATQERDEQWREALQESAQAILEANINIATDHIADAIGSLNPPKANRLITQLRKAGVSDPLLFDAIRTVAYTPGKPEKARAAKKILENLERLKEIWDLKDLASSTESAKWKAGASVIGLFVVDPRLQLIANLTLEDVRFAFYSVNNNLVTRISLSQIERLSNLTEIQLQDLKSLSHRLVADVQKLRAAKQELAGAGEQ